MDGFAPFTGLQAPDEEAGGLIDQAEREPPAHLYIVSVIMAPGSKGREWWRCQTFVVGFGQMMLPSKTFYVLRFRSYGQLGRPILSFTVA